MKRSTIVITIGIFILLTAFLGMSEENMYKKQKNFQTVDEVLQQINGKQLKIIDEDGKVTETNDLKECFSERKRLTDSEFHFGKMEVEKVRSLKNNDKKNMLEEYEKLRENYTKRRPISVEEPVSLIVNAYYFKSISRGNTTYDNPQKLKLDLILINEGEGFVIDSVRYNPYEEGSDNA